MKLFTFLLIIALHVSANSYSQKIISLDVKSATLKQVFKAIEKKSNYRFFYSDNIVPTDKKIAINIDAGTIKEVMDKALKEFPLTWKLIDDRSIVISEVTTNSFDDRVITGSVKDEKGAPLPGVVVKEKGTNNAVATDVNGTFKIKLINTAGTLTFSFVGYESQDVVLGDKNDLPVISLQPSAKALNEVIVVGYGTQSKRVVTGSIASVDLKAQETLPNTNVSQALRGRVAGVQFLDNGRPGQGGSILVRGKRSINASNDPLIILDGVFFNGSLADINPDDVESMDILKDASAAAIYGSRAANGVLLITTKTGKSEKPTINFNTYYAGNEWSKKIQMLTPQRYIQKILDYRAQTGLTSDPTQITTYLQPSEAKNYLAGNSVDPWNYVSQRSYTNSYDVNISAKNKNTSYFLSGAMVTEKGLIFNDNSKRTSVKANVETKLADWFTVGVSSQFSNRNTSGLEASLGNAYLTSPFATLHYPDGSLTQYSVTEDQLVTNPLYTATQTTNEEISQNLFANFYAIINLPIKGLSYRLNYSPNYRWYHNYNAYKQDPHLTNNVTTASKANTQNFDWTLENIVTYKKDIGRDHSFDITLLYGRNYSKVDSTQVNGATFPSDQYGWNNLKLASTLTATSSAAEINGVSSMARINYRFKNRYFVTLTGRRDGSSVFAANNKYAFFPSAALSWVASDESFMSSVNWLNFLKLRLSYGSVGNQAIAAYTTLGLTGTTQYVFGDGGSTSPGIFPGALMPNPNLKWETTYNANLAVDFQLLKGRIGGTLEYYALDTKNLILRRNLPDMDLYQTILLNLGETQNKGVEITFNTVNIQSKDFQWSSNLNFSYDRNKIVHIYNSDANGDGIEDNDITNKWFIGSPISVAYDYKPNGLYQASDVLPAGYKPGWVRVTDLTGDGAITSADRTVLGNLDPKYRWGINNNFTYKNFTLSAFVSAAQGWIGAYPRLYASGSANYIGRPANLQDVGWWTAADPTNTHPALSFTNPLGIVPYASRNFVRLQDVSFSYSLPKPVLQKIKMQNLRFYVSGRNLYTWTKWPGPDPESGDAYFPTPRTISVGLSASY
ncbi:MAG TPA: TonB-dependent receptor [Mucilaginibacter sp.]|nr:TonB-dependent receptor [Mucilaginibacter sp.]